MKLIASTVIAALLLTGTAFAVSQEPGQGVQLPQTAAAESTEAAHHTQAPPTEAVPPTQPTQSSQPAAAPVELTREEAIAIALAHAGLPIENATALRAHKDRDRGVPHWDIEWRSGDWEYDYGIHMHTGEILEAAREYDPPRPAPTPETTAPRQVPDMSAYLKAEEALAIALGHAGLTADQIAFPETEFDIDDGVAQWDVEFRFGGWEYSYELHAETGKILEQDKDWDD